MYVETIRILHFNDEISFQIGAYVKIVLKDGDVVIGKIKNIHESYIEIDDSSYNHFVSVLLSDIETIY